MITTEKLTFNMLIKSFTLLPAAFLNPKPPLEASQCINDELEVRFEGLVPAIIGNGLNQEVTR